MAESKLSPAMEQYMRFKREHDDAILFFRMGDFYEMFFEDAREAARLLGLTLTSRNHGKTSGDVPLAGVPHHAMEGYVARLIGMGRKVAICEQVEDPKKAKGLVKRDVVEIVSPGTALSDSMLDGRRNNFIASLCARGPAAGIAWVDLSTGDFAVEEVASSELDDEVERSAPAELVVGEDFDGQRLESLKAALPGAAVTRIEDWRFEYHTAREALLDQLGVRSLKGYDCEDLDLGVRAAGAAVAYLRENQRSTVAHVQRLRRRRRESSLLLDATAQRNLELVANQQDGGREGSLLNVIDRTCTPMGARLLRQWLLSPLRDPAGIGRRHDAVEALAAARPERARLREQLERVGDVERMMARLCCRRGTPRDLSGLAASLEALPDIAAVAAAFHADLLRRLCGPDLPDLGPLVALVRKGLVDDPPAVVGDGGVIREGYDAGLDELRLVSSGGREWIARLQAEERRRTGINSLKIGFNQVFGYYIEVSKANLERVPEDYTRKQTLANAERFVTPELKEQEARVLQAEERIGALESELFADLRDRAARHSAEVQQAGAAVAAVDVLVGLAEAAVAGDYVRPAVDDGQVIEIEGGRHAVVEGRLPQGRFVPNDVNLDSDGDQVLLVTGPNMAGKSTIIRQVGLIVVLAQMGAFVPARGARIGVVDRVFTRVGASDDLARGESTFMVEMNEASTILNNAGSRSLILMDELGRGTSTYDGLSLAWAVVEYLHDNGLVRPRTLFATHYHELTQLEDRLDRVRNVNVRVREEGDRVLFLHRLAPGPCDRSYGIHVARMAGMPGAVLRRAEEILAGLEAGDGASAGSGGRAVDPSQMDLFGQGSPPEASRLLQELRDLDLDRTTPMEALELLSRWRRQADSDTGEPA
ncbi:MAG: DNA mismatch repair protein MutS [Gemmatimonadaceae bacterium]|nr:DNA mismatch repair protein MutS [Gemmatimonadaceae bacterium]